jgi:hypothetical protein
VDRVVEVGEVDRQLGGGQLVAEDGEEVEVGMRGAGGRSGGRRSEWPGIRSRHVRELLERRRSRDV